MKNGTHIVALLALAVLVAGCGPSQPKPTSTASPTAQPTKAWQKSAAEMKAKLRVGMSQQEVQQLLGEPQHTKAFFSGTQEAVSWSYDLTSNVFFRVRFDGKGKVVSFGAGSPVDVTG